MNDIYITAKLSIDYIKVKIGMPSDVDEGLVRLFLILLIKGQRYAGLQTNDNW